MFRREGFDINFSRPPLAIICWALVFNAYQLIVRIIGTDSSDSHLHHHRVLHHRSEVGHSTAGTPCTTTTEHAGKSAQVWHATSTRTSPSPGSGSDEVIVIRFVGLSVDLGFHLFGLALGLGERGLHVGVAAVELESLGVCLDGGGKVANGVLGVAGKDRGGQTLVLDVPWPGCDSPQSRVTSNKLGIPLQALLSILDGLFVTTLGAVSGSPVRVVNGVCGVQSDGLVVLLDGRAV